MKYRYKDDFSKSYKNIPVAYYVHHICGESNQSLDQEQNKFYTTPHNHAEMEILLFTSGCGYTNVNIPEKQYRFEEGDIVILNPFEVHSGAYFADTAEQKHLCIDFSVSLLEHPFFSITQTLAADLLSQTVVCENIIPRSHPLNMPLRSAFLAMMDAVSSKKPSDLRFLSELYRFFEILYEGNCFHHAQHASVKNAENDFVKAVVQYINEHYSEPISTRDIAPSLKYSKEHFCRLFKTCFSVSFTDYLTQFRIEKAKLFLAEHSSSEVASMCGFSNHSHFSKLFRESVGISPKEYKRLLEEEN